MAPTWTVTYFCVQIMIFTKYSFFLKNQSNASEVLVPIINVSNNEQSMYFGYLMHNKVQVMQYLKRKECSICTHVINDDCVDKRINNGEIHKFKTNHALNSFFC